MWWTRSPLVRGRGMMQYFWIVFHLGGQSRQPLVDNFPLRGFHGLDFLFNDATSQYSQRNGQNGHPTQCEKDAKESSPGRGGTQIPVTNRRKGDTGKVHTINDTPTFKDKGIGHDGNGQIDDQGRDTIVNGKVVGQIQ